jgi:hypothetical protein
MPEPWAWVRTVGEGGGGLASFGLAGVGAGVTVKEAADVGAGTTGGTARVVFGAEPEGGSAAIIGGAGTAGATDITGGPGAVGVGAAGVGIEVTVDAAFEGEVARCVAGKRGGAHPWVIVSTATTISAAPPAPQGANRVRRTRPSTRRCRTAPDTAGEAAAGRRCGGKVAVRCVVATSGSGWDPPVACRSPG